MKVGTFRALCAAAVAGALAVPAMAQNVGAPTAEGAARQAPNVRQAQPDRPGTTVRPTAPPAGTIVEEENTLQPGTRTANFPPQTDRPLAGRAGQGRLGDAALVRWISADNEAEIRISEVAQQKAQNQQVKQFAQMMVDEHTKLGQQLQQAARNDENAEGRSSTTIEERTTRRPVNPNEPERRVRPNAPGAPPENGNEQGATGTSPDDSNVAFLQEEERPLRNRPAARTTEIQTETRGAAGMRGGANPAVAFHEQIKQECVASFTKELNSKQGAEFDKCYLGGQIMAHMAMIDTLKVADQYASADLKQTLQQARQSSEQHLQKAKDLMKQVESEQQ